jgi:hypothetical protein
LEASVILGRCQEDAYVAGFPQVPGYEIQSELGRGGMAVVYKAIENDLGREVAVKVVKASAEEPGHLQRLENEARGLAALHHPHIVDLYRFGHTADGSLFYVMPLLPGGSLEDVPKPMPEDKVVALLDHILDALVHAHAADIIHRDIKPANILFDRHGRPLLADFGAAFMRKRDTRLTTHGQAIGSSGFKSPEQARGMAVDARSDLYSVAVLAFELLTGKMPFQGEDALSTALAQIEQPVPRMPEDLKHWQAFFYRALAVDAGHRYPSAAAMRAAIHELRKKSVNTLGRTGMMVGLLVGALVIGGVAVSVWNREPQPPSSEAAGPMPHAVTPGPPAESAVAPAPAPQPPLEPLEPAAKSPTAVGDRFSDPGGPEMVLARAAKDSRPALAVMAEPVERPLYERYAKFRGRKYPHCEAAPSPAQGCLTLSDAKDFARWLSEETGEKYRVPTRAELEPSMAQVVRMNAYAWTSTCREVRIARRGNVAQRSWSRIRKAVGKPKAVQYEVRCDGHFSLKLDGEGKTAQARERAFADQVVLLVRDVSKPR